MVGFTENDATVFLEPELEPLQQDKEVLRQLSGRAGLCQPVYSEIDLVLDPIVEIPIDARGVAIGVI